MIYFSPSIDQITDKISKEYCYLFLTKPQPTTELAFVKIGITVTQTLPQRLQQYIHKSKPELSIVPINIYYSRPNLLDKRELLIIKLFKSCNSDIRVYNGREYFIGNYIKIRQLFNYAVTCSDEEVNRLIKLDNISELDITRMTGLNYHIDYISDPVIYIDISNTPQDQISLIETEHNCPNCGRACKDKRGMSVHLKKCQLELDRSSNCKYCNLEFSSIYTLERHLNTCVEYRVFKIKQECDENLSKTRQECDEKLSKTRQECDENLSKARQECEIELDQTISSLKASCQTQKKILDNYIKENDTLKSTLIQEQNDHSRQNEVLTKEKETILRELNESKTLVSKLIHSVIDNNKSGATTINNTNNNTNHHTIQVYNFNPSKFRGIFPISRLITSEEQIVRQLLNKGLTDYYRITDKSRGTIMWVDSEGNEIRDAGAQTLTSHLYDTLKEEFEAQKEYSSKQLDQPDLDVDEHNKYVKSMKVSNRVISKDKESMLMVGKQLSKSGKNKSDSSMTNPAPTSYFIKFNSIVGDRLVANCIDWIWMDLYDFGNYLYREISDLVTYRSSPTINKPHFIIHDDQKNDYSVYSSSFSSLLYHCLEKSIFSNSYEIITKIIAQSGISTSTSETSPVLEWLYEPTQDQNDTVFRQFLITPA